jgi:formylaminopyrimidine deformylase / aminopyrimidine aminohydrolase
MQSEKDATRSQAVATLIENWTTTEFESFVKELGIIVDELNIHEGSSGWKRAQEIWERVIELEVGFWPNEGEELDMNLSQ